MKDERVFISQILDAVAKIDDFVGRAGKDEFAKDQKTQSAIIMQLIIIGELSKNISEETKKSIDLPWKDIAGFRNMAVHNYFDIDLDIVWHTLKEDIPVLKEKLGDFTKRVKDNAS